MMRFPLRLTADLIKARIAQRFQGARGSAPILLIRPLEQANPSTLDSTVFSAGQKTGTELLAGVRASGAPVVWIGGAEPLQHPEMGQLARCIAGHGQHVFLETDGVLLRRRIHEFRPVSRLFLTVQLNGLEQSHDFRVRRAGAFQLALEGIRAAKLSGFLICVHARIDAESKLEEIAALIQFARALDVDGFVISQTAGAPNVANRDGDALSQKTAEARKLIGSRWWEFFSRLVEKTLDRECQAVEHAPATSSIEQEADSTEEGVRVA